MSDSSEHDLRRLNRREVLYGGAAMAAALGLAACGGSDDDGGSSSAPSRRGRADQRGRAREQRCGRDHRRRHHQRVRAGAVQLRRGLGARVVSRRDAGRAGHAGRQLPRRPHRRLREGHRRRPEHRHQARPGAPARRLGDAADLRRRVQARDRRPGRGASTPDSPTQYVIRLRRASSSTTARRWRRRRHLLHPARSAPRPAACSAAPPGLVDIRTDQEGGRAHRPAAAPAGRTPPSRRRSPATPPASSRSATRPSRATSVQDGQIGTGAYMLKSFTPGQESRPRREPELLARGAAVLRRGRRSPTSPTTTRAGQRAARRPDRRDDRRAGRAGRRSSRATAPEAVLNSETGGWLPLCMAIDMPPFDDPRVRQAMRLIVDRQEMVDQVLSGYGPSRNDLYARSTPATPATCRSASRTSTRPSPCWRRRARRA